jgi:hypothetical protein
MAAGDTQKLFVEEFNQELFVAFQNKGGVYRGKMRRKTGVIGLKTHFPKFGLGGAAQGKTRHGDVPTMNILRDRVSCTLEDRYGADYIDKLDELKTNTDEKSAVQSAITMSLARAEDDFAIAALMASANAGNNLTANDTFTSDAQYRQMQQVFGDAETMEEGACHSIISWKAYSDLCAVQSFIYSLYGGNPQATNSHQVTKRYFGFNVEPYSRIGKSGGKSVSAWFHANCLGLAVGQEISVSTDWVPQKQAWLITGSMSLGSVLIEDLGVVLRQYSA